ncbi:PKD domain-containing protein [Crocosphaera sp.]|uniref:PKD domain-containing protein n=1 Tax=Crocosphaera sp. TaxID=2729996 RepID=UPI002637DEFA|nr:PKD domain-containing protein [Crocosphaera sp.]MDJ0582894.1 PKD domain-containing protein [Crocosphaera sp.]
MIKSKVNEAGGFYIEVPTLTISGDDSVNEGSLYTLTLGDVNDPGNDTVTSYTINWGDGNIETILVENLNNNRTVNHIYEDDSNPTIIVSLTDEEGTYNNVASKSITVNNIVPTLTISGDDAINEGSLYTLTLGEVNDLGNDAVTSYTIDWGDGNIETILVGELNENRTVTYTYEDDSNPTIIVSLTDEDGTYNNVASKSITVNNIVPINKNR